MGSVPRRKCRGLLEAILELGLRKTNESADMYDDAECIKTLRLFVQKGAGGTVLERVHHKYLDRLAGYIGLQVKTLNSVELRAIYEGRLTQGLKVYLS